MSWRLTSLFWVPYFARRVRTHWLDCGIQFLMCTNDRGPAISCLLLKAKKIHAVKVLVLFPVMTSLSIASRLAAALSSSLLTLFARGCGTDVN